MRELQTRQSVTLAVTLQVPYDDAFSYLSDPRNLADWAVNFIRSQREEAGQILVETPLGEVPVSIAHDASTGVLDIHLGDGEPVTTRLVRNGEGCEYIFTLHQPPGMPAEIWESQGIPGLREELDVLRQTLKSRRCADGDK